VTGTANDASMCTPSSCRLTALARPDTLRGGVPGTGKGTLADTFASVICPAHVAASWNPNPFHRCWPIAMSFCYEVAARYLFSAPTSWANAC